MEQIGLHGTKIQLVLHHIGGVCECQIWSARSILAALLKTFGQSLNGEGLRILVAETEAITNSRPLTVKFDL